MCTLFVSVVKSWRHVTQLKIHMLIYQFILYQIKLSFPFQRVKQGLQRIMIVEIRNGALVALW